MKYEFRLRFPEAEVMYWAGRYAYADDAEVEALGHRANERGWYTRSEFLTVTHWKSPRSQSRCERNDEASVESMTRLALSTSDERLRIETLTRLDGVGYPTASVLLHFAHPDPYPIIDFRALWSLGVDEPPAAYSFDFWWAYTQACRSLATAGGVRMRTLDRALWQYSKEEQPAARLQDSPLPGVGIRRVRGTKRPAKDPETMPRTRRYPYRADIHAKLIATAIAGDTVTYSELANRRMLGNYLYRIANEEQAAGRPPLTALVVHKAGGKPGTGFLEAAKWVGFWREGESEDEVWNRAVQAVHEYWRPKLTDDLA